MNTKIIVALDTPDLKQAQKLIKDLQGLISYYKIGFEFFTAFGWDAVKLVKDSGARVFLDLKLHDIPNTVARTAKVICDHKVDMFNVHTLGGSEMMRKVRESLDDCCPKEQPLVLGVTILTSHSQEEWSRVVIPDGRRPDPGSLQDPRFRGDDSIMHYVLHLASLAKESGLNGVVSSPQEIEILRKKLGRDFTIVTPGIRPEGSQKGDQKRTMTPKQAFAAGADYIVIGRPINQASRPRQAAESILESL